MHLKTGLDPSPIAKLTGTRKRFSSQEWHVATYKMHQSGTIFRRSAEHTSRILTSSMGVSPVRISALRAMESAWKASEAAFSSRSFDLLKKSNRPLSFSKTSQLLGPGVLNEWGKNYPSSGMIVDGRLYPLKKSERLTKDKGGSYLPTPTASDYGTGGNGIRKGTQKQIISLGTMARKNLWPTPMASDWKRGASPSEQKRNTPSLPARVGGKLNPQWVEWLMGYPTGWTDLKDWATQWFHLKQEKPSRA